MSPAPQQLLLRYSSLIVYLLILLALTLGPFAWALNRFTVWIYIVIFNQTRWTALTPELIGMALNVVLFIPIGFALSRRLGVASAIWLTLAASICIELVQLIPALGREPSLGDVVTNTLGGMIGAALALIGRPHPHRNPVSLN